jgi:predicted transposase/invertase (TIGR01784 family)
MSKKKKFISPLADFLVKDVFGKQKAIKNTAGLLKAVLGLDLDPADLQSLRIVDPHLHRRWRKDKLGIVDILVNTGSGKVIHIEVQVKPSADFTLRTTYYNDRLFVDQLDAGHPFTGLRRTISINILNFILLKKEDPSRYKNVYRFQNTQSGQPFTDRQEIIILELPKVPAEDDGTDLWAWLQFFKCKSQEELDMLAKNHHILLEAAARLHYSTPARKFREIIFEYEDVKRIRMSQDAYVRQEGYEEAETKYQEILAAKEGELAAKEGVLAAKDEALSVKDEELRREQERIRQLEEELRRLRGN